MSNSDDFATGPLGPQWTFVGPAGTSAATGASATDGYLELVTPDGDHNLWGTANNTARAMQSMTNEDFTLEARFLTTPTEQYQMQGFLVEQDAQNWIRLETYSDGGTLYAFAATTVNGVTTSKINVAISGNSAPYLRVERVGNLWTLKYSSDGENWATAGSFTQALTVSEAGLFAGNSGSATGYAAQVDYFEVGSDPISDEDGTFVPPQQPPDAVDDLLAAQLDTPLTFAVADLLANDSDVNDDPLTVTAFSQPANGSVVDNGDGTWTYTPTGSFTGTDTFTYTISDGTDTDTATVNVAVASAAVSDDFTGGVVFRLMGNQEIVDAQDVIELAHMGKLELSSATAALTFNVNSVSGRQGLLSKDASYYGNGGHFTSFIENGTLVVRFQNEISEIMFEAEGIQINVDYDLQVSFGNGEVTAMLNGQIFGQAAFDTSWESNAEYLQIGANGWASNVGGSGFTDIFDGSISDVIIVDGVRSYSEVQALLNPGSGPGPLGPQWTFVGPAGTSAATGASATDGYLELVTPDGDHNLWGTANNTARAMQSMTNEDFTLEARFLTTPTEQYQMQGFLVEQDAQNWIRLETYSDGGTLYAFAATTVNGVSTSQINVAIPGNSAPYLRVERVGNLWTLKYSGDGENWATVGSFTQALTVREAGLFAGNIGSATGYAAQVDYFEVGSDPISDEDGTFLPPQQPPDAVDDLLAAQLDTPLTFAVADLLANDSDVNDDPLTVTAFSQPANGSVVDNGDGTWTYTPTGSFTGTDTFTYTISDGTDTDTATVTVAVASAAVSDDFATGPLGPQWTFVGPAGTSAATGASATDGYLELVTLDGDHNLWGTANNTARAMQSITNEDFTLEARFLTTPTEQYQMQGFLVEQDAQNWIRLETYSDGGTLYAFAATTVNGVSTSQINVAIPGNSAPYLRVERVGDLWTLKYSGDGENWATVGSFTQALTVREAGLFAGNIGSATGYAAQVDYFEVGSDPILDEDGDFVPPPQPPEAVDDSLATPAGQPLTFAVADLLANDSDANDDPLTVMGFTQPTNGSVVDNGDGTWTYTPDSGSSGPATFTYTISDGTGSDTATVSIRPPAVSDDFATGPLGSEWTVVGPGGTSAATGSSATDGYLELVTPDGDHDLWGTYNNTARAMQATANEDFTLEARFLTTPSQQYQMQGFLVEQDASNWIRFDIYSDGTRLYAFAAVTLNGVSESKFSFAIPSNSAQLLRVERSGDTWMLKYSGDGENWAVAGSFSQALTVSEVGVFAGNTGNATGYTAQVDYFEVGSDPILDEDGDFVPPPQPPVAGDDVIVATAGTTVTITVADLLANDSDANDDPLTATGFTQPANGTLFDNGGGTWTYTPGSGTGSDSFTYTISDGVTGSDTATVTLRQPIDVWYGDEQSFGAPGETQRWVNILGNVAGEVTSASYSLNGGPDVTLTLGPNTRRLEKPGDFVIELDYAQLDGSALDDVVTISVTYADGSVHTRDVTIEYESGNFYPADYAIDWSTVTDIQDVAQVVDGNWALTGDGIRLAEPGYDRFVTIGDTNWDFYELNISVTAHDLTTVDPRTNGVGVFGFGMLWNGHTNDPIYGSNPHQGWNPLELLVYYGNSSEEFRFFGKSGEYPIALEEDKTYEITLRVEHANVLDKTYMMKIWEAGTVEPVEWTVERTIAYDDPMTGSLMLLNHYYDVTYHDLSVTEITGSDIIQGTDGADLLSAVDLSDTLPGAGEIDVFIGKSGADLFVFGDSNRSYYDDGVDTSAGTSDFGLAWDFTPADDQIQLFGDASDYLLTENDAGLPEGTAIWLKNDAGPEELIGVVYNTYGLDLVGSYFVWTGDDPFV